MKLTLQGHSELYAVEQLMMQLFPEEAEGEAVSTLSAGTAYLTATAKITLHGRTGRGVKRLSMGEKDNVRLRRRILQQSFYLAAVEVLGFSPPWGALAGVRPTKLVSAHLLSGGTEQTADKLLKGTYFVSDARRRLCIDSARHTVETARLLRPKDLSVYVGIPFCPTRCAYCSFISADVKGALALVEPYVDALCREIEEAGNQLRQHGVTIKTAYMGGGTPTTLSAEQMDRVLSHMEEHLPLEGCVEFTVEAGRPDTITREKLEVLRAHHIHRISINPQTMEDSVLREMGRAHTAAQIMDAMDLARDAYGGMVNMDLIAGLPTDTVEGFARTLEQVVGMDPANITVHTLALKKGAKLMEEQGKLCTPQEVADMLAYAEQTLRGAGYVPYYLYRQKYMSGSFENVGWAKPGAECAYNIIMMEELQSVLSLGAGGITKLVNPATGKIDRLSNPKYPKEYLDSWEKICQHKAQTAQFQANL